MTTKLEHVNVTVSDLDRSVKMLEEIFGWALRWRGASIHEGESAHVGEAETYVALYLHPRQREAPIDTYVTTGGLNHVGVTVDDLAMVEEKVRAAGFEPHSHADYEPGRRFYFRDHDSIEWEVVSYD